MPWQSYPIQLQGGLVTNIPEIQHGLVSPGSARTLVNFEPSVDGGYRRINGYVKWDDDVVPSTLSSTQLLGVGYLEGTVIVPREDKIYKSTGTGWTQVASGRTQPNRVRYTKINLNGTTKLIGTDGSNYPYSWDNTTVTNLNSSTDLLGVSYAVQFGDRVFYANDSIVHYTAPFDENDMQPSTGAGNFIIKDEITGMHVFRDQLFIFTENSISVLQGTSPSNYNLTSVSETVGCIWGDTIKDVGGDVLFLSRDGIRSLTSTDRIGDFSNQLVGQPIRPNFQDFISQYSQYAAFILRDRSQYRVYGWDDAYNASVSGGYVTTQIGETYFWSRLRGVKVYSSFDTVYNQNEVALFVSNTEYVYQMDVGSNFDGTAIEASFFTPYLSIDGDPQTRKTVYKVTTYMNSEGTVDGSLSLNFNQNDSKTIQPAAITLASAGATAIYGSATYGTGVYSAGVNSSFSNITTGAGHNVSLQYSFTEDQDPFTIDTIVVEYLTEGKN